METQSIEEFIETVDDILTPEEAKYVKTYIVSSQLEKLAEMYKFLSEKSNALSKLKNDIDEQKEKIEQELIECLQQTENEDYDNGINRFFIADTGKYKRREDIDDVYLCEQMIAYGYIEQVKARVHHETLNKFVNEYISEHGDALPDWLNELVTYEENLTIKIEKSSKKS